MENSSGSPRFSGRWSCQDGEYGAVTSKHDINPEHDDSCYRIYDGHLFATWRLIAEGEKLFVYPLGIKVQGAIQEMMIIINASI